MAVLCRKNLIPCVYARRDKDIICNVPINICESKIKEYEINFPKKFKVLQKLKKSLGKELFKISEERLISLVVMELVKLEEDE